MSLIDQIIDENGGNAVLSERFGISTGAISNWRKRGYIPPDRLVDLVATKPSNEKDVNSTHTPNGTSRSDAYRQGVSDTIDKLVDAGIVDLRAVLTALVERA